MSNTQTTSAASLAKSMKPVRDLTCAQLFSLIREATCAAVFSAEERRAYFDEDRKRRNVVSVEELMEELEDIFSRDNGQPPSSRLLELACRMQSSFEICHRPNTQ